MRWPRHRHRTGSSGASAPPGWTFDCSIALPPGGTVEDVVELVLTCRRQPLGYDTTVAQLKAFGLSNEDAEVAIERVQGGLVRAATSDPGNEPDPAMDPLAYASYHRALGDRSLTSLATPFETE